MRFGFHRQRRRTGKGANQSTPYLNMPLFALAIGDSKVNDGSFLTRVAADSTVTGVGISPDFYVDTLSSTNYNGLAPFFNGTDGPLNVMPISLSSTAKKYAILTGSTINTDYTNAPNGSPNQGIFVNCTGTTYIVGWSRTYNQEVTPSTPGYQALVDKMYNTGFYWDSTYLNAYFFKMQGSNVVYTSGTQGFAVNVASPCVLRNAWVDGHVGVMQGNFAWTTEDCYYTNGGRGTQPTANWSGTISGTTLTLSPGGTGTVYPGAQLTGGGVNVNTTISIYGTGGTTGTGGAGTYATNISNTVGSSTPFILSVTGTGWWGRCLGNSVQGPRIARCGAPPGSIGEDFLFTQSGGVGPYNVTVVDNVIYHDACRQTDESQHSDGWQMSYDIGSPTWQRNIFAHQLNTTLTNRQLTNLAHPVGTLFVMPGGGSTAAITGTWNINNNILATNNSLWNASNYTLTALTANWTNNTWYNKRHSQFVDPLSGLNNYVYGFNESNTTLTHTGSGNRFVMDTPHYTPSSANDATHDSFLIGFATTTFSGFTYVQI